jgi:hypothetical protein
MSRISAAAFAILGLGAACASGVALAANPAGFYLGAGVGEGGVRNDGYYYNDYYGYHDYQTAWKLIAGMRPIAPIGLELEYIDFGRARDNSNYSYGGYYFNDTTTDDKAAAVFAVGYLPLPIPFLDVYAKAGVARLDSTTYTYYSSCQNCGNPYNSSYRSDNWTTNFAYGAGVQTKWAGLALRGEYERISASNGDPDALTVSVTWTF